MNKVNFFNLIPGAPKHIVKVRHGCTSILFNASGWMANPVLGDALCGAVARFFKYLLPAYCEEFAANLRHWVGTAVSEDALSTDNVLQPHERPDHGLRSLYGPLVFPESLVNILNVSVLQLKHVVEDADMMPTLAKFKGSVYMILYRLLLQHEDKPVQTRFWTFASCIGRLLLAKILHIPPEVSRGLWHIFCSTPRAKQKAVEVVQGFLLWHRHVCALACKCPLSTADDFGYKFRVQAVREQIH